MTGRRGSGVRSRSRSQEAGAVAVIFAVFASVVFFGLAAIGVDTARWAVEVEAVQNAADAAALAGVTRLPTDFLAAKDAALAVATKNGYTAGTRTQITVSVGNQPSQLKVKISSLVDNRFGGLIGVGTAWITRTGVADYTAPAPMGSPCNTFGNEPPSQPTAALPATTALPASPFPNCNWTSTNQPQFWAAMNGPDTQKVQGDRYMSRRCAGGEFTMNKMTGATMSCANSATGNQDTEHDPLGYFWVVHVEPGAVGKPIDVQLYDPAYVALDAGADSAACSLTVAGNNLNDYTTTDGLSRYSQPAYCTGDFQQYSTSSGGPDTTFVMREQSDTGDPMKAAVIPGCTKQYKQTSMTSSNLASALRKLTGSGGNNSAYNKQLAQVYHQWTSLCTFTPTRKGDWYLQVRTNVAMGGTAVPNVNLSGSTKPTIIYTGNSAAGAPTGSLTTGVGLNAFAIRAVPQPTTDDATRKQIAVSGYSRMPIYQNSTGSTATFNLIRALPNAKGSYIAFDFFDAADATGSGTITVTPPVDATGSVKSASGIAGCKTAINGAAYTSISGCKANVSSSANNGQLQHLVVPIPNDYDCNITTLGGCWFQVKISFGSSDVTDFTTWSANITGDPVRLIE